MVGRRDAPPVGRPYQVPGRTDPVPFVSTEVDGEAHATAGERPAWPPADPRLRRLWGALP